MVIIDKNNAVISKPAAQSTRMSYSFPAKSITSFLNCCFIDSAKIDMLSKKN
jgi:hypothetical protein